MESVLLHYQETFGKEAVFSLQYGKRWGKQQIVITVKGASSTPFQGEEDDLDLTLHNMLASMGLAPTWLYARGCNTITLSIAKPKHSPVIDLVIAAGAAVVCGILILGKTTSSFSVLMEQANLIVSLIIGWIGALVPAFIFITLFQMILTNQFSTVFESYKWVIAMLVSCVLIMVAYSILVWAKTKVSLPVLIKKLIPTFLIAITTSSSAAAFSTNVDTCENKLGIDTKIIHFGIPLGQVVFMPGAGALFFTAALCMSATYGVAITPMWICVTGIVVVVLSIAAPPIPGGALTCYTILFTQIGLPTEAIAIALVVNMVLEFLATATNLYSLQCDLVLLADSLGMLDKEILRRAD